MRRHATAVLALVAAVAACGTSSNAVVGADSGAPVLDASAPAPDARPAGHDAASPAVAASSPGADASGVLLDGGDDSSFPLDASSDDAAGGATVTVFSSALFAFGSSAGGARRQTAPAGFPAGGTFASISLHVALDCPSGGCDHWDRVGSLGVVTAPAVDGGAHGTVVEIARFVTPFCSSAAWDFDVTDLAPLLSGSATMQGFIDTWSPQGNPGANGAGWLLTATFTFTAGAPAKRAVADVPLWTWPADSDPPSYQYGDPNDPIEAHLTPQTLTLPPSATSYGLRTFVTGHGQGNSSNCAEFCQATHTFTVGTTPFTTTPWDDCSTTPGGSSQCGTWSYSRAGWCPGAAVTAWSTDVTTAVGGGSSVTVSYGDDSYVNECRPDLDDGATCNTSQCALGTGCAYDGGNHTTPIFYVSSMLVAYE